MNPTTTCTPDLYTAKPDRVEVRLRTARGDTATRTVPLPATVAEVLSHASRENCGFVLPEEAVHAELVGVRRTGRSVRVEWAITNDDELPVTIERVVDPAGMGMSLQLPVRVPGETGHPGLRVVGTLRVIDCALLAGLAAGDEAFIRMAPVHVHHAYARGTGFLPLASLQAEHSEGWTPELDAVSLAVQTCPDDVFSSGD